MIRTHTLSLDIRVKEKNPLLSLLRGTYCAHRALYITSNYIELYINFFCYLVNKNTNIVYDTHTLCLDIRVYWEKPLFSNLRVPTRFRWPQFEKKSWHKNIFAKIFFGDLRLVVVTTAPHIFYESTIHLNFRFRTCFEQGVPWHSGKYRVQIHSETRTWHGKNMQPWLIMFFYINLDVLMKYQQFFQDSAKRTYYEEKLFYWNSCTYINYAYKRT